MAFKHKLSFFSQLIWTLLLLTTGHNLSYLWKPFLSVMDSGGKNALCVLIECSCFKLNKWPSKSHLRIISNRAYNLNY